MEVLCRQARLELLVLQMRMPVSVQSQQGTATLAAWTPAPGHQHSTTSAASPATGVAPRCAAAGKSNPAPISDTHTFWARWSATTDPTRRALGSSPASGGHKDGFAWKT